jgi:large subunit ribosomal protein L32
MTDVQAREGVESIIYSPRAMAVPKKKTSKARRDKRRATHGISAPALTLCPQCHRPVRPHHACRECGHYRGREVEPLREEAP